MFFSIRITQISLLISIYMCPLLSSYNFKSQHPSMEFLAEPGLLPESDIFLNRYGSIHTMREYMYWAITEESISIQLRKKLKHVLLEKTLVRKFFTQGVKSNLNVYPKFISLAQKISNYISNMSAADLDTKQILKLRWKKMYGPWAGSRDMYLSISGVLLLQNIYLWPPVRILQDISISTSYQANLTEKQMSVIGMCSLYKGLYTSTVEWFEASEHIAQKTFDLDIQQRHAFIANDMVTKMRDLSIQEHNRKDNDFLCWKTYDCYMYLFTDPIRYTSEKAYLTRLTRRKKMLPKYSKLGSAGLAGDQFINLCSGSVQSILPARLQVKLKCYYEKTRDPYLYINPVKTEQLSESPLIFQYYDILGPKLIEEMKNHYIENANLHTLVNNVEYYNRKVTYERAEPTPGYITNITQKYDGHPIFTKFAEVVTGIKFDGPAEALQYMDYTPGRCITAHEDTDRAVVADPKKEIDGNRFADLLYYLEIPTLGGYTPFCQAGVMAHLAKGSLVIWINKFRNGTNRNDSFHGACPVIHGHKMILAQGLKYTGQENNFKCTLNQFE